MNSKDFRKSPKLLRNEYPVSPIAEMPIIQPQGVANIESMLSYHDVRKDDVCAREMNILVHFFKNDDCFEYLYDDAYGARDISRLKRLAQYTAVCTPDFSLYPEMPYSVQIKQVFKNRWCGAHWQAAGLCVLPTITWADEPSYDFCFDGVEQHSTVVVSTVGSNKFKKQYLSGYNKMLEVIQPQTIICYGDPFDEMDGNIICYPYAAFRQKESA